jgi:4'-phosphopantetheinyl transferase
MTGQQLIVIGIATPTPHNREAARLQGREALRQSLATLLGCCANEVPLVSQPAKGLRVIAPGRQIGLSLSHESGLSLGAINPHGAIGIDLMRIEPQDDWESVARNYLGPVAFQRIATAPAHQLAEIFAREWVAFEASLKCHGIPLDEWSPALGRVLLQCRVKNIVMPQGVVAALAVKRGYRDCFNFNSRIMMTLPFCPSLSWHRCPLTLPRMASLHANIRP